MVESPGNQKSASIMVTFMHRSLGTPLSTCLSKISIENSKSRGSKTSARKQSASFIVKLARIASYPLKQLSFKKMDCEFEIYGVENLDNTKISKFYGQISRDRFIPP